jgi:hypothetical protein
MSDTIELCFSLAVEDDWPPVAVEGLPFDISPAGYVSTVPPLFIKDLSVGDIIAAEVDKDGLVAYWRHISRSDNSVVWLMRIGKTQEIEATLKDLRALGCSTASLPSAGSYSIHVPGDVSIASVDAVLKNLDPEKVAIAYPSFRHPEEEEEREHGEDSRLSS